VSKLSGLRNWIYQISKALAAGNAGFIVLWMLLAYVFLHPSLKLWNAVVIIGFFSGVASLVTSLFGQGPSRGTVAVAAIIEIMAWCVLSIGL
jgi:hypothetical protein